MEETSVEGVLHVEMSADSIQNPLFKHNLFDHSKVCP